MRRLFIGDIQGCADELAALLARAEQRFGRAFEVGFVGDLVNRGPDNLRVLERVRTLHQAGRARCVLGNHDLHLIASHWELREPGPFDTLGDVLGDPDVEDWIEWLRTLPLAERGEFSPDEPGREPAGRRAWLMVHAGVDPDWGLDEAMDRARAASARLADPDRDSARDFLATDPSANPVRNDLARFTRCRSLYREGSGWKWSQDEPGPAGQPWHQAWAERGHDYGVIYGHWATQGLHRAPGLRGLDTGCVHHGRDGNRHLTAWVPDLGRPDPFELPDEDFWQQPAARAYYRELMASRSPG